MGVPHTFSPPCAPCAVPSPMPHACCARWASALAAALPAVVPSGGAQAATHRIASAFDPQTVDPHSVALLHHHRHARVRPARAAHGDAGHARRDRAQSLPRPARAQGRRCCEDSAPRRASCPSRRAWRGSSASSYTRRRYDFLATRAARAGGLARRLRCRLADCLNAPYRVRVCEAIAAMLTQVGIRAHLRTAGRAVLPR